jgi:hypothetical protein
MILNNNSGFGLSTAPMMTNGKTRSISAENPTGEPGSGGKAASNLGVGRKGKPCISISKKETVEIANICGAGCIQHIWITVQDKTKTSEFVLRNLVLRMYWDGESEPSVEVPIGDFFCNGFGIRCRINSLPIVVNPTGGMNSYFSMPFRKGARITVENQYTDDIESFFYQITYTLMDEVPKEAAYFHAFWRRECITEKGNDYVIVDGIKGKGQYIGTYLAWTPLERYWWGEGEIKFYMDGDKEWPTICGTGTEDYFGAAWGFKETYSTPFLGNPLQKKNMYNSDSYNNCVPLYGLYRWHLMDPIRFEKKLRVTIQQIGAKEETGLFERSDDISSVAYWYQTEPHAKFSKLLSVEARWPR